MWKEKRKRKTQTKTSLNQKTTYRVLFWEKRFKTVPSDWFYVIEREKFHVTKDRKFHFVDTDKIFDYRSLLAIDVAFPKTDVQSNLIKTAREKYFNYFYCFCDHMWSVMCNNSPKKLLGTFCIQMSGVNMSVLCAGEGVSAGRGCKLQT